MKKYIVFYKNRVEANDMCSFNTLVKAKNYCDEQVKGCEPFDGDYDDQRDSFKYEVYAYDPSEDTEEDILGYDPIYSTAEYWENA